MKYKAKRIYFMGVVTGYEYRGYKIHKYVDFWNYKTYKVKELEISEETLREAKKKVDEYLESKRGK